MSGVDVARCAGRVWLVHGMASRPADQKPVLIRDPLTAWPHDPTPVQTPLHTCPTFPNLPTSSLTTPHLPSQHTTSHLTTSSSHTSPHLPTPCHIFPRLTIPSHTLPCPTHIPSDATHTFPSLNNNIHAIYSTMHPLPTNYITSPPQTPLPQRHHHNASTHTPSHPSVIAHLRYACHTATTLLQHHSTFSTPHI